MTLGDRLRTAISERGMSLRGFQRLMLDRMGGEGRNGVSYPSINSYLQDRGEPSLAFIRSAADLLGVSPAWLAFGVTGEPCARCAGERHLTDADIAAIRAAVSLPQGR